MKFLIRDDDTCAFTPVEELEKCYRSVWPYIPVNLSVTPFRIPGATGCFPAHHHPRRPTPLGNNAELVSFLRERLQAGRIGIALHGYSHVVTDRNPAMRGFDPSNIYHVGREYYYGTDLLNKTRAGKAHLEELLRCGIKTFVPPGNAISDEGVASLIDQGLNLVGAKGLGVRALLRKKSYPSSYPYAEFLRNILRHGISVRNEYPFVADFGTYKETGYYTLAPNSTLAFLKSKIDYVHSMGGVFILSTHYHEFAQRTLSGETIENALHELLDYVNGKRNVSFISYEALWDNGRESRGRTLWRTLTHKSS